MVENSPWGSQQTSRSVYYLFASPVGAPDESSASVFHRVEGERLAQSLTELFTKKYGGPEAEFAFHCMAAASMPAPDQVLHDEALQWLEVYSDPDIGVYDPRPTKDTIIRAQYAVQARTWEGLLRTRAESADPIKGKPSSGNGEALPPLTDKAPGMPAEDWRNAGLSLLMLLAQAYYKLLESAVGASCAAVDLELNHSYLWTLKSIRNLLTNHPDLAKFPIPFEPVFPDLYPSTLRDVDWEDMVAPGAERFLSAVQEYVMDKGIHPPEEHSPAWIFIEMFKPSIDSAIQSGVAYRRRMNQYVQKVVNHAAGTIAAQTATDSSPSPTPQGCGTQATEKPSPTSPASTGIGTPPPSGKTPAPKKIKKRATRAAAIDAIKQALREHLRAARDHAYSLRDNGEDVALLPRPTQEKLANQLKINVSSISRALNDPSDKEIAILWETANHLDQVMDFKG